MTILRANRRVTGDCRWSGCGGDRWIRSRASWRRLRRRSSWSMRYFCNPVRTRRRSLPTGCRSPCCSGGTEAVPSRGRPPPQPLVRAPELIADIQRELTRRGFYDGPADGVYGPKTDFAIRDFEQTARLRPSSEPNDVLLATIARLDASRRRPRRLCRKTIQSPTCSFPADGWSRCSVRCPISATAR